MKKTTDPTERPYRIYDRDGRPMESRPLEMRHPREIELSMMNAGYIIKINGKKLTKKELMK